MIVCVCNNISDREIRQAVDLGISSMPELRRDLGVGTCCGKCVSCARETLHEALEAKASAEATAALQSTELSFRRSVPAEA
ncbi:2Fe-2S ferredoxin [Massilia arenosa]|uniref:Bacterioferritin-associated ferredoxin n=1 Tax=Zemynaea arenosa TaxID=2561931 RepID=A0A4Y9S3D2_9BURK|nr:(2Fe-2S)-binding protein [Massilia arenosa]TFW15001.1 2Fe-2S ferredoxin [Massilia arenosa]